MVDTRATNPVPMDDVYRSKTINPSNMARYNHLPAFPTIDVTVMEAHLLANVPVARLSAREVERRRHAGSTAYALQRLSEYSYRGEFSLSTSDTAALANKLHVHKSIVTYNAHRFRAQFFSMMDLRAWFRRQVIVDDNERQASVDEPRINSHQVAIILEFYLQMDVDVFYMKTCSFRGAQPHGPNQGLFCETDEPIARYGFLACQQPSCALCHPSHVVLQRAPWPVVTFSAQSKHCFVNGYTTYLNCPATCTTSNVIYVLTCPCGEYDYVDSTNQTLSEAMAYHRERGNRVIHQYLTGSPLGPNATTDEAMLMRLYQHSAHCTVAMRAFLDANPRYWCFIPIPWDQSPTTDGPPPTDHAPPVHTVDRAQVMRCLRHVPRPPTAHYFSQQQRTLQHSFFEYFLSLDHEQQQRSYRALDLFRVNIIVVLPEDRSSVLRYVIETMFVIHGETKLNMICPIDGDPKKRYGRPYQRRWHHDLCHRTDWDTATAISTP